MTRLLHTEAAFVRSLQMSRFDLFAFVEGWTDRYRYDKLCKTVLNGTPYAYEVRTADELPSETGGKAALLSFYSYLRNRKLLFHEFKGKKLAAIFFVDKDIDDYLKSRKRSPHVIYTEHYSFENYLFKDTDLSEVVAAASSLDLATVRAAIGNHEAWRIRAAAQWKEWTILCVITRRLGVNCPANYSRQSQINKGPYGGIDPARLTATTAAIQAAATTVGLTALAFQSVADQTRRHVERAFRLGRHDLFFNGKWYVAFLTKDVHQIAAGRGYDRNGFQTAVLKVAAAKLDFLQPWAGTLRASVERVLEMF